MRLSSNRSTHVEFEGKNYLYFGGTNFLGLAQRPELIEAALAAFEKFGLSSGASRLTSGDNEELAGLERELAQFAASQSALVLPAGFLSNQAVVEGLDHKVDVWIAFAKAHASIHAALKHSKKEVLFLEDPECGAAADGLREHLGLTSRMRIGLFLEPIFPLKGRLASVCEIRARLAEKDILILDEAQSMGVLGENGRGAIEHFKLPPLNLIRTGTFSKAFGAYGGFVLADPDNLDLIRSRAASVGGSTSLPPAICAAARASIRLIENEPESNIQKLNANIIYLNRLLSEIDLASSKVPIFYQEASPRLAEIREKLLEEQIYLPSVSSYFSSSSQIGLRWTIQAAHSREQLDLLVESIKSFL
ncbi:MAG: pyridoxal phosphate-dependent aminotransferase family protein [Candidatus Obscuribacterales bacterium]|nr:pyridoxal phosphate-dependent aminotransferase family protein [Candidatus Obscuribacterales bacterium]